MNDDLNIRIEEHARERFFQSGFSKVTMEELSQELGISKKTMYQRFRGKDELLDAVMNRQMAEVGGTVRNILASSDDFITKLVNLWTTIGRLVCRISKQFQDDMRRYRPDLWSRIEEMRRTIFRDHFGEMLNDGIRNGLVRDDVNREVLVLMYISALQGVVHPAVVAEHSFSTEEAFKTIMQVYFDGILTEPARRQFHNRIAASQGQS